MSTACVTPQLKERTPCNWITFTSRLGDLAIITSIACGIIFGIHGVSADSLFVTAGPIFGVGAYCKFKAKAMRKEEEDDEKKNLMPQPVIVVTGTPVEENKE